MRKYLFSILLIPVASLCYQPAGAQTTGNNYNDINDIHALAQTHGDMWWDLTAQVARCEYPANSGKNIMFAGAVWMGGYDAQNNLHIAAQTYRQDGNDYWPGPLEASGVAITSSLSQQWDKIWKVNASEIQDFIATGVHTVSNTPESILRWPGKGNSYATNANNTALPMVTSHDYAPFVDVNGNGVYDPLNGDYPSIKGDQALWWIYNDNGPTHDQTGGLPLGVEVRAMSYAYAYASNPDLYSTVYYEFKITNTTNTNYHNFRLAQWIDADLGASMDDFVGCDTNRRIGFVYNASPTDAAYGTSIPVAGVTIIHMPGDTYNSYAPLGSFTVYNNNFTETGNPSNAVQCDRYMHNQNLTGEPESPMWMTDPLFECDSNHTPSDRRYVMSTGDNTLSAGETVSFTFALITTDRGPFGCPNTSTGGIEVAADAAWRGYYSSPEAVANVAANNGIAEVYPNPIKDVLQVSYSKLNEGMLMVSDITGRVLAEQKMNGTGKARLNMSTLGSGVYLYKILDNGLIIQQGKMVKE